MAMGMAFEQGWPPGQDWLLAGHMTNTFKSDPGFHALSAGSSFASPMASVAILAAASGAGDRHVPTAFIRAPRPER